MQTDVNVDDEANIDAKMNPGYEAIQNAVPMEFQSTYLDDVMLSDFGLQVNLSPKDALLTICRDFDDITMSLLWSDELQSPILFTDLVFVCKVC